MVMARATESQELFHVLVKDKAHDGNPNDEEEDDEKDELQEEGHEGYRDEG